jgi:ABC-2 type transport system permease protein
VTEARIHEQGYRRYEGERRGVGASMRSLSIHAVQRVLGLKRRAGSKIMPIVSIGLAFIPAVVFIVLAALLSGVEVADEILPSYGEYYGFISFAVLLFSAFVAPEALCTDRKSGMLSLYLASPLTRDTYLAAKAAAVLGVLLVVTMGPQLFLLVAYTLESRGPGGVLDFAELLGRIVAGGIGVALLPAAMSLGISSLTPRRAFASAGIAVGTLASGAVVAALTDPYGADLTEWLAMFDFLNLPFEFGNRMLGERSAAEEAIGRLASTWIVAGNVGWAIVFGAVARFQYQRVAVER